MLYDRLLLRRHNTCTSTHPSPKGTHQRHQNNNWASIQLSESMVCYWSSYNEFGQGRGYLQGAGMTPKQLHPRHFCLNTGENSQKQQPRRPLHLLSSISTIRIFHFCSLTSQPFPSAVVELTPLYVVVEWSQMLPSFCSPLSYFLLTPRVSEVSSFLREGMLQI